MGRLYSNNCPVAVLIVLLFLFSIAVLPLYSEEGGQVSIDDLFNQPVKAEQGIHNVKPNVKDNIPNTDSKIEESVNMDDLTISPTKFSGSVSSGIGIGLGLAEWPGSAAAEGINFPALMRYSGFYSTSATLSVDARPKPYLRFYSSVSISLDANAMAFTGPDVSEIFVDYTFRDTVFCRVGKQSLTWGNGRLLGNPANLVSRVSEGVAVRVTMPVFSGTLDGVVYSIGEWVGNPYVNIDPRTFAYAGQWESGIGPLTLSLSSHFKMQDNSEEDFGGASSVSFGIGPFDFAADLAGHWDREHPEWNPAGWKALGQIFWESDNGSWSLLSEYLFDSSVKAWRGHYVALGLKTPKPGRWQPTLRWKHAFQDNSGEIVTGISGSIAPDLDLTMAVPIVYGAPGTYYRNELSSNWKSDGSLIDKEDSTIPVDNVISLLFSISLSFSF